MTLALQTVERAVATWRCWQEAPPSGTSMSIVQIAGATFAQAPRDLLGRALDEPIALFAADGTGRAAFSGVAMPADWFGLSGHIGVVTLAVQVFVRLPATGSPTMGA